MGRRLPLVLLALPLGCTLATSLDGFTEAEGTSDGGIAETSDGAVIHGNSGDAVTSDGGSDGAVSDSSDAGPAPSDGGSDADADGVDAAPVRYCATLVPAPTFCEDFDGPTISGWTPVTTAPSVAELVPAPGKMGSQALRSAVAGPTDKTRTAFWRRVLEDSVTQGRLAYSAYIEVQPSTGAFEINLLRFLATNNQQSDLYTEFEGDRGSLWEQVLRPDGGFGGRIVVPSAMIPLREWFRVIIEVDIAKSTVSYSLDGRTPFVTPLQLGFVAGRPTITAGISYAGVGSENGVVLVDDIVFQALP